MPVSLLENEFVVRVGRVAGCKGYTTQAGTNGPSNPLKTPNLRTVRGIDANRVTNYPGWYIREIE